ncbi:MAG: hypothetical protein M0Z79_11625 [Nitrospiraceae bacterium]|nr:hypothetical protein [Nitrospiraceae bacterium]
MLQKDTSPPLLLLHGTRSDPDRGGQSRVSDLVRDKWEKFSLEMLIALEAKIGRKMKIELAA